MQRARTNALQFFFKINGLRNDHFFVHDFHSINYDLSQNYRFIIHVNAKEKIAPKMLCGQAAQLNIVWGKDLVTIHGVISVAVLQQNNIDKSSYTYQIQLASPLFPLSQRINSKVFVQKSTEAIVREILSDYAWSAHELRFLIGKATKIHAMIIQLNETDLSFIERLLQKEGLFYYFEQQESDAVLVIFDDIKRLPQFSDGELLFQSQSGAYRPHETVYYLNQYCCTDSGWRNHYYLGKSDCRGLILGQSFAITDHYCDDYNQNYRIVGLQLTANQSRRDGVETYCVKFIALTTDARYAQLPVFSQGFHHFLPASIEAQTSSQPYIDNKGHYRVRLPFDSQHNNCQASCAIYALQPTTGIHFPLHKRTQVALGFIMGDLDRPVILGVAPSVEQVSPVTDRNAAENIIASFAGNRLVLSDLREKEAMVLETHGTQNLCCLNADIKRQYILLRSKRGNVELLAGQNAHIAASKCCSFVARDTLTITANGDIRTQTEQNGFEYSAGANMLLISKNSLHWEAEQRSIVFSSGRDFNLIATEQCQTTADESVNLITLSDNIQITINKTFSAQADDGVLHVGDDSMGFSLSASGDVQIDACKFVLEAEQINIFSDAHYQ